jgi:hypothetical protein
MIGSRFELLVTLLGSDWSFATDHCRTYKSRCGEICLVSRHIRSPHGSDPTPYSGDAHLQETRAQPESYPPPLGDKIDLIQSCVSVASRCMVSPRIVVKP